MKDLKLKKRKVFLNTFAILGIAFFSSLNAVSAQKKKPLVPMIQTTDLYHSVADPDDHYDLASIYSLAYKGLVDIKGILIDYPSQKRLSEPDVMGVAQMNYYTGLVVPLVIGTSNMMKSRNDIAQGASKNDLQGIDWLFNTLKNSPEPVVLNVVGTTTDVAIAIKRDPELFRKKCKAIYLNAGTSYIDDIKNIEYNVALNPSAYAAIFDAPCPIYWMPCFNLRDKGLGDYGTYFKFAQSEILPFVAPKLQNFFIFALDTKVDNKWFSYLNGKPEADLIEKYGQKIRNMWCTAGFLHAVGKKVTMDGEIVDLNSDKKSVFSFVPVNVTCDDQGLTTWTINKKSTNRYIFHVEDLSKYEMAMTKALKTMLLDMPK